MNCENTKVEPITTYHEKKIGKTLYRVTSVYLGKFELKDALEDLIVKKILRAESMSNGEKNVESDNKE